MKEKILTLNVRVSNIQYSSNLDFDKTTHKPHISHIYTEVAQKQGNNQIAVKQRKNGNSPYTNFNEFSYRCQDLITFLDNKQLGTTS